jgi:hypothetical protein
MAHLGALANTVFYPSTNQMLFFMTKSDEDPSSNLTMTAEYSQQIAAITGALNQCILGLEVMDPYVYVSIDENSDKLDSTAHGKPIARYDPVQNVGNSKTVKIAT